MIQIRVYTLTEGNTLQEFAYDNGHGWYNGGLGSAKFQVAPYSRVAAVFLAGSNSLQLRIYGQKLDNSIQEYLWDGELNLYKNLQVPFVTNVELYQWLEGEHQPWTCPPWHRYRSYLLPLY